MSKTKIFKLLLLPTLVLYLPILLNPKILLDRGNDLEEQFWPVFHFIKVQIATHHQLPLWNNLFLSGTPLLQDPQFSLFYLPNFLFVVLPIGIAFIVYFFIHSLLGGLGIFLLSQKLKLKPFFCFLAAAIFILSPKMAGFLIVGHFGLLASYAWAPWATLFTINLIEKKQLINAVKLSIALASIFFTHTVTFILASTSSAFLATYLFFVRPQKLSKTLVLYTTAALLTFGLTAITLLPQYFFLNHSTRTVLLQTRDVYPKWSSIIEFFKVIIIPWWPNIQALQSINTEKTIAFGMLPTILSLSAFFVLKRKQQAVLALVAIIVLLVSLNTISPLYPALIRQDWYALMRVSTRIWFVPLIAITLLTSYFLNHLSKSASRLAYILSVLVIVELLFLSWSHITVPISKAPKAPPKVYQYLSQNQGHYRVFCTTRCLSQKLAATHDLQLVDGYNTVQQKNYSEQAWQLTGSYWDYYTLSIPPIGSYKFGTPQPDPKSLGEYNTKYVVSPYPLSDPSFQLEKEFGEYKIYTNALFMPRANAPILYFSPNQIVFDTTALSGPLRISEVYSPGWNAQETPSRLRQVNIPPNTTTYTHTYHPPGFKIGMLITSLTLIFITYVIYTHKKK